MKTLQVPKFDSNNVFTGYVKVFVKNKMDHSDYEKVTRILPGFAQGYCPALYNIVTTGIPIEITHFYDARQNTKKLKGYYISVI